MVILLSDGMLDFEAMPGSTLRMETILQNIKTTSAQRFADELMKAVPVPPEGHDDDRTVMVAALWETGRPGRRKI